METYKGNGSEESTEAVGEVHQGIGRTQREGIRDKTWTQTSVGDATARSRRVDSFTGQPQRMDTSSDRREIPAGCAGNSVAITLSELPNISLVDKRHLPSCQCVYLAYQGDQVFYVGQSLNLAKRWKQHHHYSTLEAMGSVRIAWLEVSNASSLLKIESALIEWFKPILNKSPLIPRDSDRCRTRVAELRKRANLTQRELANRLNVTESTIANWESGRNTKIFYLLAKLCRVLNCRVDELGI